jgi:hypothetical protein
MVRPLLSVTNNQLENAVKKCISVFIRFLRNPKYALLAKCRTVEC